MSIVTLDEIITLARQYVDDNHKSTDGWKQPSDWFRWLKPELLSCYRKWIRESFIALSPIDISFTEPNFIFSNDFLSGQIISPTPMVIMDVVENLGSGNYRRVMPPNTSRQPYWAQANNTTSIIKSWNAAMIYRTDLGQQAGSDVSFGFDPLAKFTLNIFPAVTGNYTVRYIGEPEMELGASPSQSSKVYLPSGMEDYVALRLARKALASEGGSSQAIERLLAISEAEWKMLSLGSSLGNAAKVRITSPRGLGLGTGNWYNSTTWETNPYNWYYL